MRITSGCLQAEEPGEKDECEGLEEGWSRCQQTWDGLGPRARAEVSKSNGSVRKTINYEVVILKRSTKINCLVNILEIGRAHV